MDSQGTFTWLAIWAYDLPASRRAKIIPTVSSEYSLLEVFGFEGMIDFGEELVKWQSNKNCLKVGESLSKQRCIFTTNTQFVQSVTYRSYNYDMTITLFFGHKLY